MISIVPKSLRVLNAALSCARFPLRDPRGTSTYTVTHQPYGDLLELRHECPRESRTYRFNRTGDLVGIFTEDRRSGQTRLVFDEMSGFGDSEAAHQSARGAILSLERLIESELSR